jgi:NAD(P)-dependent dehydrogenase (short-subunit alcohol dehydrogenase family)
MLDAADLRRQLEVNLVGVHAVTRAALPALRRARGRIVNIGSLSGRIALPFYGPYAASKFALEAYTDVLRQELAPAGVYVALVEIGAARSGIWRVALESAEHSVAAAPAALRDAYAPVLASVRRNAARLGAAASPPERVAAAIVRAIEDPRPRPRYRVAYEWQTRALRVLASAPAAVRDRAVRLGSRR